MLLSRSGHALFAAGRDRFRGIPPRPIVENPVAHDIWSLRIAHENCVDVVQRSFLRIDLRIFVGTAIRIIGIAAGRWLDRMRAVTLPIEEHSRDAAVDDRNTVCLRAFSNALPGNGAPPCEDRRIDALLSGGPGTLRRIDAKADDGVRLQAEMSRSAGATLRNGRYRGKTRCNQRRRPMPPLTDCVRDASLPIYECMSSCPDRFR